MVLKLKEKGLRSSIKDRGTSMNELSSVQVSEIFSLHLVLCHSQKHCWYNNMRGRTDQLLLAKIMIGQN